MTGSDAPAPGEPSDPRPTGEPSDPRPTGEPSDPRPTGEPDPRPELDIDTAFAAIVAGFATPVPRGVGSWPASEDLDDDEPDAGGRGAAASQGTAGAERRDVGRRRLVLPDDEFSARDRPTAEGESTEREQREPAAGGSGAVHDLTPEDEEGGYVPPVPPPLPRGDRVSRLAWGAVICGPAFLLVAAMISRTLPPLLLLLALLAFVAGFVTLVARLPSEHPDDPDDGAVV